jgi:hypothetical protein
MESWRHSGIKETHNAILQKSHSISVRAAKKLCVQEVARA